MMVEGWQMQWFDNTVEDLWNYWSHKSKGPKCVWELGGKVERIVGKERVVFNALG